MSTISIQEIQQNPAEFLRRIESGESLIVVRESHPVAEVKPVKGVDRQSRPYGLCVGEFTVPADFDEPLPEVILREFEGQ